MNDDEDCPVVLLVDKVTEHDERGGLFNAWLKLIFLHKSLSPSDLTLFLTIIWHNIVRFKTTFVLCLVYAK